MLEEWRSGRDSVGRTHEAHWKILLENTKVPACPGHMKAALSQCPLPSQRSVSCRSGWKHEMVVAIPWACGMQERVGGALSDTQN